MTTPESGVDWVCASCGGHNLADFAFCQVCGNARTDSHGQHDVLYDLGVGAEPVGPMPAPPTALPPTPPEASASNPSNPTVQPAGPGAQRGRPPGPSRPSPSDGPPSVLLPRPTVNPSDNGSYDASSVRLGPYRVPDEPAPSPPAPPVGSPTWQSVPPAPVPPPSVPPPPEWLGAAPPGIGSPPITMMGLGRGDGQPLSPPGIPPIGPSPYSPPPPRTVIHSRPGQWSVGDSIAGRFTVHGKVVSGMGVVYLCYDEQAHEPVAIKTYLDGVFNPKTRVPNGESSALAQQFESEALLWIRLGKHPHVVQARYVLRLAGKPHIFLEYVPGPAGGESTVRRLLRAGRVDVPTALLLAIQTCAGMEHATRVFPGFVHRDLKPENLLLTPDRVLKVTDFGLTRVFADFSGEVGVVAGTPPYMSPEQCLGLPALDTRSDVYALGVILYELLTGRRPFLASHVEGHLRAHLIETPPPPSRLVAGISDGIERLVLRCLAKHPEDRFSSFTALRAELTACYQAETGHPPALPDAEPADTEAAAGLAGVELARAISLVTLGRYEEAMTFFDLAVEHDPSLARAWFFRGMALNGLGRFDEALACLERVVTLEPRDEHAWVEKGRALTRSGRREEALTCFDRAIAINPWHLSALYEKGVCLLFLKRFAEAAVCIDAVAAVQPGPAVEAARQACLAGQQQHLTTTDPPARSSGTYFSEPFDGLDMRT